MPVKACTENNYFELQIAAVRGNKNTTTHVGKIEEYLTENHL